MPANVILAPQLIPFATLKATVGEPLTIGRTPYGLRRAVPILGGHVSGEGWTARVMPGGTDYQLVVGDTLAVLEARYVLETDAGDYIYVRNSAIRQAPAAVTARLLRGEPVDPAAVYFRCLPRFETGSAALGWINERLFVGTGVRNPDSVEVTFFELA